MKENDVEEEMVVVVVDESRKAQHLPCLVTLSGNLVFLWWTRSLKFWQTHVQILACILAINNWVWEPDDTLREGSGYQIG